MQFSMGAAGSYAAGQISGETALPMAALMLGMSVVGWWVLERVRG
jgi:hypothetical protein